MTLNLRLAGVTSLFVLWSGSGTARFLQADPIGTRDDVNLYAYVQNNPTNVTDPSGEFGTIVGGAIVGSAVGAGLEVYDQLTTADSPGDFDLGKIAAEAVKGAVVGAAIGAGQLGAARLAASEGATGAIAAVVESAGAAVAGGTATLAVSPAVDQVRTGHIESSGTYAAEAVGTAVGASVGAVAGKVLERPAAASAGNVGREVGPEIADNFTAAQVQKAMLPEDKKPSR